jgi:hypothetical protein
MKELINFLKLPPNILSALVLASGFIIFAPAKVLEKLYFIDFKEAYGFYVGLVFIVSISILFVYIVIKPAKYLYDKRRDIRISENQLKYLRQLSNHEKHLIRQMLSYPDYTMELPTNNGMVIKLQSSFVISPAGTTHLVDAYDMRIPFLVQPWVVKMTSENPDIGI